MRVDDVGPEGLGRGFEPPPEGPVGPGGMKRRGPRLIDPGQAGERGADAPYPEALLADLGIGVSDRDDLDLMATRREVAGEAPDVSGEAAGVRGIVIADLEDSHLYPAEARASR